MLQKYSTSQNKKKYSTSQNMKKTKFSRIMDKRFEQAFQRQQYLNGQLITGKIAQL